MTTSNGGRLIVYNIVRNSYLWSDVVFKKEVIFHEFDFQTSNLEFEVSKSSIWKPTTSCDKGVFSFIIISQFQWPTELERSQVCCFMHMLGYNINEKTGGQFHRAALAKKLLKHENSLLILHKLLAEISFHIHCFWLVFSCCLLSITIEWSLGL